MVIMKKINKHEHGHIFKLDTNIRCGLTKHFDFIGIFTYIISFISTIFSLEGRCSCCCCHTKAKLGINFALIINITTACYLSWTEARSLLQ